MTVGSLFSGIGGFDLGLERAGHEILWQVEWDAYCQKVLAKHWPDVPCHGDIHEVGSHNLEKVDMICGGFPCQPVSVAGKRKGQDDDRWLWPEFGRLICELRPKYVLVENVPGLLVRGMGDVLGDLSEFGYDAEWGCVSAKSVGAPHLRKRIFIIAHANSTTSRGRGVPGDVGDKGRKASKNGGTCLQSKDREAYSCDFESSSEDVADTSVIRLQKHGQLQPKESIEPSKDVADATSPRSKARRSDAMGTGDRSRRDEGLSQGTRGKAGEVAHAQGEQSSSDDYGKKQGEVGESKQVQFRRSSGGQSWERNWATEPDVGRVAHGVPNRVHRLRGLGNAIVPQVAEYIGRRVQQMENADQ
jgi:DNA (cytosine-5)-methyltransferase 1